MNKLNIIFSFFYYPWLSIKRRITSKYKINDLNIRLVDKLKKKTSDAEYNHKTKTIFLLKNYRHPDFAESLFVHELIHFLDDILIKNINLSDIQIINEKLQYTPGVNFQINDEVFLNVFKTINGIKNNNYQALVDFDLEKYLKDSHSPIYLLFNSKNEYRATTGQHYYEKIAKLKSYFTTVKFYI